MSERLPSLKATEVIAAIRRDGWYEIASRESHRYFEHPEKPGKVTVPVHGTRDIEPRLLYKIIAQAGLTVEEFRGLL